MNIAFVAHDNKKELMGEFCIAYKSILQRHQLYATAGTGTAIMQAAGLDVHKFAHGLLGGEHQIAARLSLNEMDMLIYFRDPFLDNDRSTVMNSLFAQCDMNNIPFATNIATAEVLIKGLERGDLCWREIVNPNAKT